MSKEYKIIEEIEKDYDNYLLDYKLVYNDYIINLFNGKEEINENEKDGNKNYFYSIYKKNEKKKYLIKASKQKNIDAILELGNIYEKEGKEKEMEECYKKAYKLGNSSSMNILGLYYEKNEDYKKSVESYKKAIKLGDECALYNLSSHYKSKNDMKNAKKYLKILSEKNDPLGLYEMGQIYLNENEIEKGLKYCLLALNEDENNELTEDVLGNINSEYDLYKIYEEIENKKETLLNEKSSILYKTGDYYRKVKGEKEEAIKYYLMAIENDNCDRSLYMLGNLYQKKKEYEISKKYYLMSIEYGENYEALYRLARLYHKYYNDEENALKYYLMYIDKNRFLSGGLIIKCFSEMKNKLIIYKKVLEKINDENISEERLKRYKDLEKILLSNDEILLYSNKLLISKKYNMIDKCNICLEEKIMITLHCNHLICESCYIYNNKKCYFNYCNEIIKNDYKSDGKFHIIDNKKELSEYEKFEIKNYRDFYYDSDDDTFNYDSEDNT
jgi:TPR repeat protein